MEVPTAHHHALRRAGVPVGLLAAPNARPPGSLRSPSVCAPKCSFGTFRCSGRLFFEKAMLWPFLQNARPSGSLRSPSDGRGKLRSPLAPHRNAPSEHSGVPVGFFFEKAMLWPFLQNARPSGSLRSPSGGRGKLRSPLHPSLLPPEMRRQTGGNPPLREKLSFGARHGFPFCSAYPQEAWSFLRTPPRPAAKRAASTRAATPLPPPASSFFLTARSSFRTSRRP